MNFRIIVQPLVACIIAVRAGLTDAREGRPAFFWAALTDRSARSQLLHEGWRDVGKVFILATILDAVYQLRVHSGVYFLELALTATLLAIVPYLLVRGPVSRLVRRTRIEKQVAETTSSSGQEKPYGSTRNAGTASPSGPGRTTQT